MYKKLGQDDDYSWTPVEQEQTYAQIKDWKPDWTRAGGTDFNWVKEWVGPITSGAASIIRAITGQPEPRQTLPGRYGVGPGPTQASNLLLYGAIGIGAVLLLTNTGRRRR